MIVTGSTKSIIIIILFKQKKSNILLNHNVRRNVQLAAPKARIKLMPHISKNNCQGIYTKIVSTHNKIQISVLALQRTELVID
jgi:hypothetical protein